MVSSSGGVKDSWASARPYGTIEVSSRRFEIHVYDPERTELEVSGVEDEALPDLVGKFDAVEGNTLRALGMRRDRPADHEKAVRDAAGAVDGVGGKDLGANITKLFDGATDRGKARPHR